MGCVKGYRPDGLFDRLFDENNAILENGYSTLLQLRLLQGDLQNGKVEARLFTSAGPVSKDANGKVIRDMSQTVHDDPMYHSEPFPGEIKDGKLLAGPVDARLRFKVQAIDNHYYFRDLKIAGDLMPDGSIANGVLAGYWDIENMFDFLTEVYIGPVHLGQAAASAAGYLCGGVHHALPRVADGHPDADGNCTSMSTTVRYSAVLAFVIEPQQLSAAR